ncbi:helix-turn-helix transcriptional regulator [Nonomuraea dietziae]|uniref:helix-turn-helix transcriptional regulator n=1 Tax=Nonomuraea dietziae TaxID=65515 RepID=UPI00342159A7
MNATGLGSGTIYPIASRLGALGWVESRQADPEAGVREKRPTRYYRLTADGLESGRAAFERAHRSRRQPAPWLLRHTWP